MVTIIKILTKESVHVEVTTGKRVTNITISTRRNTAGNVQYKHSSEFLAGNAILAVSLKFNMT
jgi:hypothetical protein